MATCEYCEEQAEVRLFCSSAASILDSIRLCTPCARSGWSPQKMIGNIDGAETVGMCEACDETDVVLEDGDGETAVLVFYAIAIDNGKLLQREALCASCAGHSFWPLLRDV